MPEKRVDDNAVFYLVGGGIASLAAAAFLIRDGGVRGQNIIDPGGIRKDRWEP